MRRLDTIPETDALAAIAAFDGRIFVDFDETLYLGNSTEDYLGQARPALIAAILLLGLDALAPWRRSGSRDGWRIRVLRPLIGGRWGKFCAARAAARLNAPLAAALEGKAVTVVSNGFAEIIQPMLDAMALPWPLITFPLAASRTAGKAGLLGPALEHAMLITDSEDDAPALALAAHPILTRWSAARHARAFAQLYLPGDYLRYAKRPWQPGALRQLALEDALFWLLLGASFTALEPAQLAGILLLFASLWSVYEAGYRDNDVCALAYEADPVVTPQAKQFETRHFEAKTWMAAGITGAAGLALLGSGRPAAWAATLLALRATYYVYNRTPKPGRVWLYPALQGFRSLALLSLLPAAPIALAAGFAQITARCLWYAGYRARGAWPATPRRLVQLILFLGGAAGLAVTGHVNMFALVFLAWNLFIARQELARLTRH